LFESFDAASEVEVEFVERVDVSLDLVKPSSSKSVSAESEPVAHQKTKWIAMAATLMAVTIWQMSSAVMVKGAPSRFLAMKRAAWLGGFGDS
jgi:hypothetical protein